MGDAAAALREAAKALEKISDTPRIDAELLLAHALEISRDTLLLDLPKLHAPAKFATLIDRRKMSEPVAHIIGTKEFWGLELAVSPDVLVPRPDSETLLEEAVRLFDQKPPRNILDLGTGSGALLLAALHEFPGARGVGIDASAAALQIAHNNADSLGFSQRAQFALIDWTHSEWTDGLADEFDLILANPPYIATDAALSPDVRDYEPHQALFAGESGLDDYLIILPALERLLTSSGVALLEIGFDQAEAVSKIAERCGYHIECKKDLGGNDRLLVLTRQK